MNPGNLSNDAQAAPASGRTLIERTYERLRDDILDGVLAGDEKLRVQHLKEHYDASAGTLREAITRLVSDALVITEGQRGFRVAPISAADFDDLTQLRIHIEIEALRQSMRNGNARWRDNLREVWIDLSALEQPLRPENAKAWEKLNTAFHEALLAGCNSPWTLRVLRLLARQSERYRRFAISRVAVGRDVHAEHREIYESVLAGNELRAALALEAHIARTAELITRKLNGAEGR
ncbi:MAG: GntR family transcriptional regulator [Ottowia sp.]|nr:GntR family transcriptional regulator [Ottowia sp.]